MFSRSVYGAGRVLSSFTKGPKHSVLQIKLYSACIKQGMEQHKVVPDVIPVTPKDKAKVVYPSGAVVDQGNELKPRQVKDIPDVYWNAEKGSYYVLCMTDPDAPSRADPKFREWHHWLVGNIPCDEFAKGEVLSQYIGAGPPEGTGLHRYVFLIFKQPKKLVFNEERLTNTNDKLRAKFSIVKFARKYDLGNPIAGNFFQAQWDDYVPELYKQLGAN